MGNYRFDQLIENLSTKEVFGRKLFKACHEHQNNKRKYWLFTSEHIYRSFQSDM